MDCHKGIIEGLLKLYSRVILRVSVKASSFLFINKNTMCIDSSEYKLTQLRT